MNKTLKSIGIFLLLTALSSAFVLLHGFAIQAEVSANITPSEVRTGATALVEVTYLLPDGMHQIIQEEYFFFDIEAPSGIIIGDLVYPKGKLEDDGYEHLYGEATLTRTITISPDMEPGDYTIELIIGYQLCYDSGTCIMPEEIEMDLEFSVVAGEGIPVTNQSADKGSPILLYLFFALLGGFILNLTPCVLPVLSLRAFSLMQQSQSEHRSITLNSLVYSAGVIFSFLALAVIVIVLKASGELVGWGFQFQNPTFVLILTALIFVFSLSLFDVFVISAPDSKVASKLSSKKGLTGAFFMGIFAVLLGTPCTAPILGAALAFAFAQPIGTVLLMFFLIGLGMALPFIIIAFNPKFVKKLPKPGEWMNVLKEIMGFLLLIWAIKMLEVLYYQLGGDNLLSILFFFLALAFAFRIIGRFVRPDLPKLKQMIALIIAVLIIIGVGQNTLKFGEVDTAQGVEFIAGKPGPWQVFSPQRIDELRAANVPVFIDFTARWCTTCEVNEKTVLFADDILQAFEDYGFEIFIADFTRQDDVIFERIQSYGRVGVPVYVFYLPGEDEPILLPEIINKRMVFEVLERLDD
jgi:thiol:disulfide interchange protein